MENTLRNTGYGFVVAMAAVLLRALWRAEPVGWSDLATAAWAVLSALAAFALIDGWKTLPPAWRAPGGDGEKTVD